MKPRKAAARQAAHRRDAQSSTRNPTAQVQAAARDFGFPLMLKARRLAYDGRGNAVAKTAADIPAALQALGGLGDGHALYAERWAPFVRELAVMVVRSTAGEVKAFPVVETVHRDNICDTARARACLIVRFVCVVRSPCSTCLSVLCQVF